VGGDGRRRRHGGAETARRGRLLRGTGSHRISRLPWCTIASVAEPLGS
jgi:hypothetical protein